MERIKLAIEKARAGEADLIKNITPYSQELNGSGPSGGESVISNKRELASGDPLSMQYVQTAVVALDAAHLERNRVISHQKTHPASWAFDVLRTQVLQRMDENGWRTLAVTSPSVESGKTVVSINLAMSIAQQAHRTALLVDFDLRRPKVAATLGINRSLSLNDVLDGRVGIAEAMVNPGVERFVVLPANHAVTHSSEMLSSAKVDMLVNELRERYSDRIVIFDLPPVLAADDVMAILPRIDCILMVVASGVSTQKEIEEAMNRLSRAHLIGVVLNKENAPVKNAYY